MIKQFIKRFIGKYIYGHKNSSESYIAYLRQRGVRVGEHVQIFAPHITNIEAMNPHLLSIGSHVAITGPASILTHDYSVCVTKIYKAGEILGNQKPVTIDDNVFIGWGACILPGTHIKGNTIIGAQAVVSGELEGNSVYAGNPAKRICGIEEYYEKRKRKQLSEAITVYKNYIDRFHKKPDISIFHEYFFLFGGGSEELPSAELSIKFKDNGNEEESIQAYVKNQPLFPSFDEFCEYADKELNE